MGAWIGTLGGLGMVALIARLLLAFLEQMGARIPRAAWRTMARAGAVALVELMIAGLFYHMDVAPVSLLDLPAVWRRLPFWLPGLWPFNGYAALMMGAWTAWTVSRRLGPRWMNLLLAFPGAPTLFLPSVPALAAFGAALALRLIARKRVNMLPEPPYPLYLALLGVLSVLSGWFIIAYPGGVGA